MGGLATWFAPRRPLWGASVTAWSWSCGPLASCLVLGAGRLKGIISERDYARKVILKGKSSLQTPVREIMTQGVVTVRPGNTVEECMGLMTEKRIRHLPVVVEGQVVGVISIGDVVKASLDAKDFVIQQLGNYITGDR